MSPPYSAAGCFKFGFLFMAKMYMVPYWINVMWLDVVTYLHHTDKEVILISTEWIFEPTSTRITTFLVSHPCRA